MIVIYTYMEDWPMSHDNDLSGLREDMGALQVDLARTDERVKHFHVRMEDLKEDVIYVRDKVDGLDEGIKQIRDKLVCSKVDTQWTKKIIGIILTALLSGGGALGYIKATGSDAAAKETAHVEVIENGMDND